MARAARKQAAKPLSKERIELAALKVIERDGLQAFSTRRLAAELRCEAMSIYHYFPSRGHLMDALVDRIVGEIPAPPPPDRPWRERIEQVARDWRTMTTSRPSLFVFLATHRLNTPVCLRWLEQTLALFADAGLDPESSVRMFRAFGYYLMGAGLDETAGYARGPSTVEPVPDDVMRRDFPGIVAAGRYFAAGQQEATFEHGLRLFLDGVETQLQGLRASKQR